MFLQVGELDFFFSSSFYRKGTGYARYREQEIAELDLNQVDISDECRWHHESPPRPADEGGL